MICLRNLHKRHKLSLHNGDKVGQARRVSGLLNTGRGGKTKINKALCNYIDKAQQKLCYNGLFEGIKK